MNGKLIVIEGLDGSRKITQAQMLLDKLTAQGVKAKKISLLDYV